jgi:hypothetical protein
MFKIKVFITAVGVFSPTALPGKSPDDSKKKNIFCKVICVLIHRTFAENLLRTIS